MNTKLTPTTEGQNFQDMFLREEHIQSEKGSLRGCFVLKKHPSLAPDSLFGKGYYTIQDQASQLIAHLVDLKPNVTLVDAASGPGGKLSHLAELGGDDVKIIAVEMDSGQMKRAQETAARLGHKDRITWVEQDFMTYNPTEKVDRVLLDAPCTGMGVLRKHPEGKWHKDLSGIKTLSTLQRGMIKQSLGLLKPGGELVYSVCSFEPEETEDHLEWLKKDYGERIEVISLVTRLPDYFKRYVTRDSILMIYAGNQDDMDGFGAFAVRWKG